MQAGLPASVAGSLDAAAPRRPNILYRLRRARQQADGFRQRSDEPELKRLLRFGAGADVLSAEINLCPGRLNFIQQMAGYPAP